MRDRQKRKFKASLTATATLFAFLTSQVALPAYAAPSTAVLGLDGVDENASSALTDALRRAFSRRNMSVETNVTVAEMRLMMNCTVTDDPCLARAGQALKAERLLYGSVEYIADGIRVQLQLLDTQNADILALREFDLNYTDLAPATIDATAAGMAETMISDAALRGQPDPAAATQPDNAAQVQDAAPEIESSTIPVTTSDRANPPEPPQLSRAELRDRELRRLNRDPGRGLWQKVGFGFSVGFAAAAWGTALWTRYQLADGGPVRNDLLGAANKSLEDDDPENNIRPDRNSNLCSLARMPRESDDQVRNAEIASVCDRGERLSSLNIAAIISGTVLTISSAAFLGLMIRHRQRVQAVKRIESQEQRLGVGWYFNPRGDFGASATFRF